MIRTVNTAVITAPALKREDCSRSKHDSAFSDWKILIGPCDWDDYLLNKEGAERYRTHNLPNCFSCPGLYELGIAVSDTRKQGKIVSKLDSKNVIPVYLGQADSVRTRLQQYGRDGAHLQNDRKLFSEIFSNGFAIVFRWAPMESKKDAKKAESRLLETYDYAWNRGMNGERRPNDIHKKLNNTGLHPKRVLLVSKNIRVPPPKEVGLRIKRCDPPALEISSFYTKQNDIIPFVTIFKFGRSRPTLVSKDGNMHNNNGGTCGVTLGHGSICIRPPVEGRKRCADHKGMKVNAYIRPRSDLETGTFCNGQNDREEVKHEGVIVNKKKSTILGVDSLTCVAITCNGSFCRRKPSENSQFCWQHEAIPAKIKHEGMSVSGKMSTIPGVYSSTCVAITLNGSRCTRNPSMNSQFCWQHEAIPAKIKREGMSVSGKMSTISGVYSSTCVATTRNGSRCRRKASMNSQFCWQH